MDNEFIKYCKRCIMPETKPDLFIDDEGICSGCRYYEQRTEIDWEKRRNELNQIMEKYKYKCMFIILPNERIPYFKAIC